jgi:hypothetical protein
VPVDFSGPESLYLFHRYAPFCKSIFAHVSGPDGVRNQIVHWTTLRTIEDGPTPTGIALSAPATRHEEGAPKMSALDLAAFHDKCDVIARAINILGSVIAGWDERQLLRDMLLQRLEYPLPAAHPPAI